MFQTLRKLVLVIVYFIDLFFGYKKIACFTTIYVFMLNDGSKASIEIECDWIVLNGKNYNFITGSSKQSSDKR